MTEIFREISLGFAIYILTKAPPFSVLVSTIVLIC